MKVCCSYCRFMRLLDQYEGVSFGDSLFGCFVLFPLQQRFDVTLRKVIWAERPLVLRTMFAPGKEVRITLQISCRVHVELFWASYSG